MEPPFFIMGLMLGVGMTLAIQAFANRKVRKALALVAKENASPALEEAMLQRHEAAEMHQRLAVLERIVTDRPVRLASEIERLR